MRSVRAFFAIVLMAALAVPAIASLFVPRMARASARPEAESMYTRSYAPQPAARHVGPPVQYVPASKLPKSGKDPRTC